MTGQEGFSRIRLLSLLTVMLGILSIYLVFVSLGPTRKLISKKPTPSPSPSPRVLAFPSASGIVSAVGDDSISLDDHDITLTTDTKILRKPPIIPYHFSKSPQISLVPAARADLEKGDRVEVMFDDSKGGQVAKEIILPRIPYIVQGSIKSKNGSSIAIEGAPILEMLITSDGTPLHLTQKQYIVKLIDKTEVSQEGKQYTIDDLADGQVVTIYAESDVTKATEITAALIEPVP